MSNYEIIFQRGGEQPFALENTFDADGVKRILADPSYKAVSRSAFEIAPGIPQTTQTAYETITVREVA